jgi:hypothetical protein
MVKFMIDDRAQAGAVFRLMVDAIIGLAILAIVVYMLTYFNGLRREISKQQLYEVAGYAVNSPNGKVFMSDKDLLFSEGDGFSSISMSNATSKPADCFTFESNLSAADVGSGSYVSFRNSVEAKVYAKCWLTGDSCASGAEDCCIQQCLISIGKKLDEGEGP